MYDALTDHCKLWLYKGHIMNHLHKKDTKKLIRLREEYLKFVYKKHIYSVLLMQEPNKHQKMNQALAYIGFHPQCLEEFLASQNWNESDRSILRDWKEEHYGEYRIVDVTTDYIEMYDEENDNLYRMKAIGVYLLDDLQNVLPEHRWKGSFFRFRNEFVLDSVAEILMKQDATLEEAEDFYEYMLRHRNMKGAYINDHDIKYDSMPERIQHDNFSELMHDFIAPMGNANNLSFQEFGAVIKLASLGWNLAQIGEEALQTELAPLDKDTLDIVEFFQNRKNKYFKENKTLIQSAEAYDENEGFELRLVVGNMEDLAIEQTAD